MFNVKQWITQALKINTSTQKRLHVMKKNGCSHWKKNIHNDQRLSWADLLIACYCHHKWKGLPWLHRALTLVYLTCLTFQTFTICSSTIRLQTHPTIFPSHKEFDSFMIIDPWWKISKLGHWFQKHKLCVAMGYWCIHWGKLSEWWCRRMSMKNSWELK